MSIKPAGGMLAARTIAEPSEPLRSANDGINSRGACIGDTARQSGSPEFIANHGKGGRRGSVSEKRQSGDPRKLPHRRRGEERPDIATVLVDVCPLVREGLLRILANTQFRVAAAVDFAAPLPVLSSQPPRPVLVILGRNGDQQAILQEIERSHAQYPSARRVVIGEYSTPTASLAILQAGVDAVLPKIISTEALVKALELVMLGEMILPSEMASAIRDQIVRPREGTPRVDPQLADPALDPIVQRLSTREVETLYCLLHGDSNKLIARKFTIAEATVKVHIKAILRKIGVQNRTQAAIWAMKHLRPRSQSIIDVASPSAGSVPWNGGVVHREIAT